MCRHSAREISKVKPFLDEAGVRLVAVGFDAVGLQNFINGGFFSGELLLDTEMEAYRGLRLNRLGFVSTVKAAANPRVWKILKSVLLTNPIPGDFEGDGMQLGATYVVDKGGEVVFSQKQRFFGDIPSEEELQNAVLKCKHIRRPPTLSSQAIELGLASSSLLSFSTSSLSSSISSTAFPSNSPSSSVFPAPGSLSHSLTPQPFDPLVFSSLSMSERQRAEGDAARGEREDGYCVSGCKKERRRRKDEEEGGSLGLEDGEGEDRGEVSTTPQQLDEEGGEEEGQEVDFGVDLNDDSGFLG